MTDLRACENLIEVAEALRLRAFDALARCEGERRRLADRRDRLAGYHELATASLASGAGSVAEVIASEDGVRRAIAGLDARLREIAPRIEAHRAEATRALARVEALKQLLEQARSKTRRADDPGEFMPPGV